LIISSFLNFRNQIQRWGAITTMAKQSRSAEPAVISASKPVSKLVPVLVAAFCLVIAPQAGAIPDAKIATAIKPGGNAQAGEAKAAACGGCHGADGNSAPEIYAAMKAPKLAGQVPEYIVKSLHDFKAGRRVNEMMTPQAQAVSNADIADIAAYYGSQKATAGKPTQKELLAQGEKIFFKGKGRPDVVAACVGCHGLNGIGNRDWGKIMALPPVTLAPAIGGQHGGYIADQLMAYKTGKRSTDASRVMRDIAGRLTAQDIAAVSEYIATLQPR
jgi:cytochrome c553